MVYARIPHVRCRSARFPRARKGAYERPHRPKRSRTTLGPSGPFEETTMTGLFIHKSVEVEASIGMLWTVLTDSDFIKQYMFGCIAESDWKPGSPLLWKGAADGKLYVKGSVVSIDPPHSLAYTVFDPNSQEADVPSNDLTMTYTLKERGDTASSLEITRRDLTRVENGERRCEHSSSGGD